MVGDGVAPSMMDCDCDRCAVGDIGPGDAGVACEDEEEEEDLNSSGRTEAARSSNISMTLRPVFADVTKVRLAPRALASWCISSRETTWVADEENGNARRCYFWEEAKLFFPHLALFVALDEVHLVGNQHHKAVVGCASHAQEGRMR